MEDNLKSYYSSFWNGSIFINRQEKRMPYTEEQFNQVYQQIEKNKPQMINLQKELTRIPAMGPENKGDGEEVKADALVKWLKQLGFSQIETIYAPDERVSTKRRPNVILTVEGNNKEQAFWIMSHLDIVPPGEITLWQSPPFEVKEKEGILIGRGVEDNQQGLVASVYALASLLQAGLKPHYTVKLLFVADEEVGSAMGIQYLLKHHKLFNKADFFLVPDAGNEEGTLLEVAEKSMLWLKFRVLGKQCHASVPEKGINAFLAGSALVLELDKLHQLFNQQNELFNPPHSTFTPTKKESNVPNINTIPGEDIFYLDCRVLPSVSLDEVLERIRQIMQRIDSLYQTRTELSTIQRQSSSPTPLDAPIVAAMKRAIKQVYGVDALPQGVGGGTVAAFLRNAGYASVVWSKLAETAHMPNEYCIIDNLVGDAKVMASIMLGI
jgi:succinyl-diaminopimelate desuccinylase